VRPIGDIRMSLRGAFKAQPDSTWRAVLPMVEVNVRAPAELLLVRRTVENMVRCGELERTGRHKLPGERAWHHTYALTGVDPDDAVADEAARENLDALDAATRQWAWFK
jgi:hypothetical protein